ncbi:class I SAM-dependent methyltransferase [Heyndrickxia sporothermodurans]|uniref:class I SAM-dependent methyltransferase n=2 Tax=Heyndrickxia sporothermodurans TaxID=46224 RepID=UPI0035E217EC
MDSNNNYKDFTEKFYEVDKITDSFRDLQWGSSEGQKIRFQYLTKLFEEDKEGEFSLLDVGCGLAHFYDYLSENYFVEKIHYSGLDIQTNFIKFASEKHPKCKFINKSLFELETQKKYDYVVASGTFNIVLPDTNMDDYLKQNIKKMYELCNKGIAFNLLTTNIPSHDMEAINASYNPIDILKWCFDFTNKVNLYHSYKINDFTIAMYK